MSAVFKITEAFFAEKSDSKSNYEVLPGSSFFIMKFIIVVLIREVSFIMKDE